MKSLSEYSQAIDACVKCGACRATCPVFGAENQESCVARGKITLAMALLDKDVSVQGKFIRDMSQCLLCGSCTHQCPNQVPTMDIVAAARREIAKRKGLSGFGKCVATLLENRRFMNLAARGSRLASTIFCDTIPEASGLRLRFPLPMMPKDRTFPKPAATPFLAQGFNQPAGGKGEPGVLFFAGCGVNYLYPEIGESLIRIVNHLGLRVTVPDRQVCCGLPAFSSGAEKTVEKLAKKNLDALKIHSFDYVLTACASCHHALSEIYPNFGKAYRVFSEKTLDIQEFLSQQGLIERLNSLPETREKQRVTYHDPCHLRNPGLTHAPRKILSALPQFAYVEMKEAGTCCGLGGTYSMHHYETSKKIGKKKAERIARTQAEWVATSCPGCMIQLQDSLNRQEVRARAVHVLQLVSQALGWQG